ncbi:MAG: DUF3575 domain-containing protein [Firmicutes bacterium]|nr:DUF3575 domain-containing protein [Bacillota bacterium]
MKKILIFFLSIFIMCLAATPLRAAENSLTVNPISLILGAPNLDYERSLNDHFSVNISGNKYSLESSDFELKGSLYSIGGKYYFSETQRGSYFGMNYNKLNIECEGSDDDNFFADLFEELLDYGKADGISLAFGYRKITDSGFTFDVGGSMNYYNPKEGDSVKFPMIWFALGYGW